MVEYRTFEEIFNKLIKNFQGEQVEVNLSQQGINLANFMFKIEEIKIKPLPDRKQKRKWSPDDNKIGVIIIRENKNSQKNVKIPFLLGYNTMQAVFSNKGVTINSLNINYIIKKCSYPGQKGA